MSSFEFIEHVLVRLGMFELIWAHLSSFWARFGSCGSLCSFRLIWAHLGSFGVIRSHLGSFSVIWGHSMVIQRTFGTIQGLLALGCYGHSGSFVVIQGSFRVIWGHMRSFGSIWGHSGPYWAIWSHLGLVIHSF